MQNSETIWNDEALIKTLKEGGVAVMPTDTLYGIVGEALNTSVVNRIYSLRHRSPEKPCIILIGNISELDKFRIVLNEDQKNKIKEYWPGPVSIVLDCPDVDLTYLHRGTNTLAFRLPLQQDLQNLLLQTSPLIAPSANTEGNSPAQDITEAKVYFGEGVDLYIDAGEVVGKASKLIRLSTDGSISVIRE